MFVVNGLAGDVVVFERTEQNDLIERQVRVNANSRVLHILPSLRAGSVGGKESVHRCTNDLSICVPP